MAEDPREATPVSAASDVEELFGTLFLDAMDCILFTRVDGGALRANPAACRAPRLRGQRVR
jgi:hypothetical protein